MPGDEDATSFVEIDKLEVLIEKARALNPVSRKAAGPKGYAPAGPMTLLAQRAAAQRIQRAATFVIGAADRLEAEAEKNERKVLDILASGRALGEDGTPRLAASSAGGEAVQRRGGDEVAATRAFQEDVARASASGTALPPETRQRMERAFGADFSQVRVHYGSALPAQIQAVAFTRGNDIFFRPGEYDTEAAAGQALLGHELTHVVQQSRGAVALSPERGGVARASTIARSPSSVGSWSPRAVQRAEATAARPSFAPIRRKALSSASRLGGMIRRAGSATLDPAAAESAPIAVSVKPADGVLLDRTTLVGTVLVYHAGVAAPAAAAAGYGSPGEMALASAERAIARRAVARKPFVLGGADRYEAEAERNERKVYEALLGRGLGEDGPRLEASREQGASGSGDSDAASYAFQRDLEQASASGSQLPGDVRRELGQRFGADFSTVRIHTGARADALNRSIQARAFTVGSDIFFGAGEYDPSSARGQSLLAHELTHVVQQSGGRIRRSPVGIVRRDPNGFGPPDRRSKTVVVPPDIERDPLGALCTLPNDQFWEIVSRWDAPLFSRWAFDGDEVSDPRVFSRFRDVLSAQPSITRSPQGAVMPGWELALDLGALDVPKPAPEGPAFRAGHPDEKKPHDSHDPFSEAGQAGGEEADKHSKQRAVLAALTRAAKRMRLATDSPGLRFPRPQTTAELMKMSKMEFWATVSRWDASTFAARIHDGKEIRDRALLNRLKDCFGRKDSLKAFEETAKNILEHLTEKKYGNLLHEAENAAWDGRTVGDVMKGGGRGIAGRALRSVQKLEQAASDAPSFVTRMISKVAGFAKDLFGKVEGAISGLAETLEHAEQPWIRNAVKFVESLLAPAKEMFQTLGSRAGGWLESLKTIGGKFKTLAGRVFEFLGPWATRLAFLADVWSWTRGPRTLAERTKDHEIKEDLERNDGKADLIANLYYGPNILADLVSVVGTFVPVVKPAGFVADLFNIAWGGIEVGWGRWKMSWGGVGLPLMDTLATKLARKRRGSSRFDDEDEELGRIYERILAREGKEPGISLDISTKYRLERILGHELGEVRIHQGPLASNLAKATEADAFTVGSDIYVPGSLDLSSPEGLGLLVHEATHVAQLGAATPVSSPRSLGGGASGAVMEDVARSVEARFLSRARSRHPIMAEPAHREEPAPSIELAALEAPAPLASAPREKAVQRQAKGSKHEHFDPVSNVMRAYKVRSTVSQEEFLELCTERLMNLLREELTLDSERRESVRWNDNLPSP